MKDHTRGRGDSALYVILTWPKQRRALWNQLRTMNRDGKQKAVKCNHEYLGLCFVLITRSDNFFVHQTSPVLFFR